jgi:hypothetical protein
MLDLDTPSSVSTRSDKPETKMAYTMENLPCPACCSGLDPLLGNELRAITR